MTRDEVIRMAREAGLIRKDREPRAFAEVESFAALVAAAEREACALICDLAVSESARTAEHCRLSSEPVLELVAGGAVAQAEKLRDAIRARGNS